MSQLISGKEAKLLLAQENEVQYLDTRYTFKTLGWCDANDLTGYQFSMKHYQFRLKPRTVNLNDVEVPAPFKPKEDCIVFIIDDGKTCNYRQYDYEFGAEDESNWIGIWRTEEEIKQVVAALRSVFKGE